MLDLNAKLRTFRKMVWDEEKAKSEEELYNSTNVNGEFLDDKRQKLEDELRKAVEARESFSSIRYNEQISKTEEDEKNRFYAHKNELLDDMVGEIKRKIIEKTKTDEYKEKLPKEIEKAIKELEINPVDYEILVKKDDLDLIDYPNKGVIDDRYLGGFVIRSKDGSFQYNRTYLNKLNDNEYEIGRHLYSLFERESFNESNN